MKMLSYPINLLLEKRRCLVVGGGPVAARKVGRLLQSKALVKVVAPTIVTSLETLAAADKIEICRRPFAEGDLEDVFLVFTASDNELLNAQVLALAQSKKIIVCAVDNNWAKADFLTPASCFESNLQLAVSSDGRACGHAKAVKNYLADHLDMLSFELTLIIYTIRTDRCDRKELFEPLSSSLIKQLALVWGLREFVLLVGSGGLELVTLAADNDAIDNVITAILKFSGLAEDAVHICKGQEAFVSLWQGIVREIGSDGKGRQQYLNLVERSGIRSQNVTGLIKLSQLMMQAPETAASCRLAWRNYEYYCRKQ